MDEGLVNYLLARFSKPEMTIIDPFAGEKTIEKCGKKLRRQVISSDIQEGQDARDLPYPENSMDLIVTHPPYWNAVKYTDDKRDLSNAKTYRDFLFGFNECLTEMARALKPSSRLILVIGDYRKRGRLYPLHTDVIANHRSYGLELKAIWIHPISASRARYIGTEFLMSHDYILILEKG